jgi:hypothetical protein
VLPSRDSAGNVQREPRIVCSPIPRPWLPRPT